jgi:hypothetical protein
LQVVGSHPDARSGLGAVLLREPLPRGVDGNDRALSVEHRDVGGEGVDDAALEFCAFAQRFVHDPHQRRG